MAQVLAVQGDVIHTAAAGKSAGRSPRVGDTIAVDDGLRTLGASAIVLGFKNNTVVTLGHDQDVTLDTRFLNLLEAILERESAGGVISFDRIEEALESGLTLDEILPATAAGEGNSNRANTGESGAAGIRVAYNADATTPDSGFDSFKIDGYESIQGLREYPAGELQTAATLPNTPSTIGGDTSGSGAEDGGAITGTLTATDPDGLTDGSYFSVSGSASNGTVTIDPESGAWSYTPNPDFHGADGFIVTVTDDKGHTTTQEIAVTVTPVNDPATVSSANVILTETDAPLTASGTLTSVDIDNDDNAFTPASVSGTYGDFSIDANGNWAFTAHSAFDELNVGSSYTETFNVTSIDGTPTTVQITIQGTNDGVTLRNAIPHQELDEDFASYTIDLNAAFGDIDAVSGELVFTVTGNSNISVSIDANGIATISPATPDWHGSELLTATATDAGGQSASQSVIFNVLPVADAVNDTVATNEDVAVNVDVLANDTFSDTNAEVTSVSQGSNGSVVIEADGTVTYTPNANYSGSDSFTYTVTAGGVTETATVTVDVAPIVIPPPPPPPVNQAPTVALSNTTTVVAEDLDTSSSVKVADITVSDDALGTNILTLTGADASRFEIVDNGGNLELHLKAGEALDHETNATLDVVVNVDDATVGSTPDDSAVLSITVTDVNDAPSV
ncbi:retention module-containing protein, partial [Pseudomaricurvus sp. HS19]|uniref:retention module-containing protein n=1 Tax=Pseudomaricurvus sp. HS19 TaxID=2692626 RepID=UPI0013707BF8|nr:retention module-containing protein [Pseudomaricurvus sp. HS19]